jgi:hypothetical protein
MMGNVKTTKLAGRISDTAMRAMSKNSEHRYRIHTQSADPSTSLDTLLARHSYVEQRWITGTPSDRERLRKEEVRNMTDLVALLDRFKKLLQ